MEKWHGWDKVQYESDLDHQFADEITSIPGGEKLFSCIQCGTCSGMCPLSPYMDHTPRQIVAMIRAGFRGEVLSSYTTWLCASCRGSSKTCGGAERGSSPARWVPAYARSNAYSPATRR